MTPWYKGFKGDIKLLKKGTYRTNGIITKVNNTTLEISELQIDMSTSKYKQFLQKMKKSHKINFKEIILIQRCFLL